MRKKKSNKFTALLLVFLFLFPITFFIVRHLVRTIRTKKNENLTGAVETNSDPGDNPAMDSDAESYGEVLAIRPVVDQPPVMEVLINPANGLSKYDLEGSGATAAEKRLFADLEASKMVV